MSDKSVDARADIRMEAGRIHKNPFRHQKILMKIVSFRRPAFRIPVLETGARPAKGKRNT